MANIYCGFLLFPLLLISFIKVRFSFFHKAIFAFAFVCLLAAGGKYFYVRTLLYNFLPGLNMLRHAAIFRVFTMFGFVFITANGFAWLVNVIQNENKQTFAKAVLLLYFILLLIVFVIAFVKDGFVFYMPVIFNTASIAAFNTSQNAYAHITVQLFFQLALLLVLIVVLYLKFIPGNVRVIMFSIILVAEIFISARLNLPATVVSDVKPELLQAKLDKLSTGFPIPPLSPMDSFTHYSNGSTLPVWYNLSFFKKTPAKDGFNSFYLQSVDNLNASPLLDSFLKYPVIFFKNPDTKFQITKFEPGNIVVKCKSNTSDTIFLQQNFYPGWKVYIDNKEGTPQHELCSMYAAINSKTQEVRFEYQQAGIKYLLLLSFISALLIICILLVPNNSKIP